MLIIADAGAMLNFGQKRTKGIRDLSLPSQVVTEIVAVSKAASLIPPSAVELGQSFRVA